MKDDAILAIFGLLKQLNINEERYIMFIAYHHVGGV